MKLKAVELVIYGDNGGVKIRMIVSYKLRVSI